jgi:hypothetical protein
MQGGWDLLSFSSKKALRFAWAAAQERTGYDPPSAQVDSWDLLVGILLSHPGDSEAELTFRRFGLVGGQALPDGYPQLTAEGLNRRLSLAPPDQEPPLAEEVDAIIGQAAVAGAAASRAGVAELRTLWAALLEGRSRASDRVRTLLGQRGVDAALLASQTRRWVEEGGESNYRRVLEGFRAGRVDVINYKADQPSRGEEAADRSGDDFVGISAEVDAFAYLIASRSLEPPLAIGLFGDWGSGKSYFLNAIRRRIDQLIESEEIRPRAQGEIPFWKRIVQVDFNAWHYVEGDLWSSLVDHIFTQLNLASEKVTDNEVERRQRYYLRQLETTSESLRRLEARKDEIERKLDRRRGVARRLARRRAAALAKLRRTQDEKVVAARVKASQGAVVVALEGVGLGEDAEKLTFGEALHTLASARAELERGRALLRPIFADARLTGLLLTSAALAAVVPFAVERLLATSGIAAVSAGLASALVPAVGALGSASRWVGARLDEVEKAKQEVNRELADAASAWRERVEQAERRVRETSERLDELARAEAQLKEDLEEITQELNKRPPELLYEFLRNRLEAGEYRKRLGVPAIIRRDFKSLADLIGHQNTFLLAPDELKRRMRRDAEGKRPEDEGAPGPELLEENDPRIINRIVLYVDDLDRCPDAKVIEVLQAVHLLLAFPLFVVVVAVDSRWLAHALQSRYPALARSPRANGRAAAQPSDYLEKIFQVPFWVQELDGASRSRIVRGLLGGHVVAVPGAGAGGGGDPVRVGYEEARVLAEMIEPRSGPPLLDTAALSVTREELAWLDRLAPLMGRTPRSIKRFVNVYQLVKILRRGRTPNEGGPPSDDEIAAFLLAVAEGLPEIGWRLLDEAAAHHDRALSAMLDQPVYAAYPAELARLREWLADGRNAAFGPVTGERLDAVASDVRRFLFRVGQDPKPTTALPGR